MSDLFCAARILVCRHGQAGYEQPGLISDDGGWLTDLGRTQARDLGAGLAQERVAAVYTSTLGPARETGDLVARALGLSSTAIDGVQEFSVGGFAGRPSTDPGVGDVFAEWVGGDLTAACPGAESGEEVIARFTAALEDLADRHRGETVVVISHGGVMSLAIPLVSTNANVGVTRERLLPNCAVATVEVDADGWRFDGPWPGVPAGE